GGAVATIKFAAQDGASYKGIALAGDGAHFRLYAADFHNGKIDVLDNAFVPTSVAGGFVDRNIPSGFAPFNIMNLQGNLYVSYAKQQPGSDDEAHGVGLGFVDVFDADGFLLARVATRGKLNAPWGMAIAPAGFGAFSNHLLVGNFGDGTINAYDLKNFTFAGQLRGSNGRALVIDGLWGIAFGNGFQQQPTDTLFFAAGPDDEGHGLYGRIDPAR
ncbi:MAG TPA: TIGR03118 family protein, partial [Casimicrobiaceae bacterium]